MTDRLCDRRNRVQHISFVIVAVIVIGLASASIAAQVGKGTGEESLTEHSGVIIDVQAYFIVILCAALVGLVLWNVKDLKNTMRTNHHELKKEINKKVSIQVHNAICDKQIEMEQE